MYLLVFLGVLFTLNTREVMAADFSVDPVNIFFEAGQRATILHVKNQADAKLTLQLTAYAWAQDEEGKDIYTASDEVIIFPKILSFERGEERIVRMGIKAPAGKKEKTFRVYLEEIPVSQDPLSQGAVLRTIMRVGVPVFVSPVKAVLEGTIESLSFSRSDLSFSVKNTGNIHFIIKSIQIDGFNKAGEPLFRTELGGWYLLEGRSRTYTTSISRDICTKLDYLTIRIDTDRLILKEYLEVRSAQCSP